METNNLLDIIIQKNHSQRMSLPLHSHQMTDLPYKVDGLDSFLEVVRVSDGGAQDFQVLFLLFDLVDDLGVGD